MSLSNQTILLTSFATWRAQQASNAADNLLLEVFASDLPLSFLRGLPVNLPVAKTITIAKIQQLQPQAIVLCGMAETRQLLTIESRAVVAQQEVYTTLNLEALTAELSQTAISHDAGRFVCNSLYYAVLSYLKALDCPLPCLFVHVPRLTTENRAGIVADFRILVERVVAMTATKFDSPSLASQ